RRPLEVAHQRRWHAGRTVRRDCRSAGKDERRRAACRSGRSAQRAVARLAQVAADAGYELERTRPGFVGCERITGYVLAHSRLRSACLFAVASGRAADLVDVA